MIPTLIWWQWALGALVAFLEGVAKTGVPGLGILVVPLMVLAVGDAQQSAGWLLLRYLQVRSSWHWGFSNLVALLRQQIFVYRDLWKWLNQPDRPPVDLDEAQLRFAWQV